MYICKDCRTVFFAPAIESEDYGYETDLGYASAYQDYYVCPNCGSTDVDEENECAMCGDSFPKDEMGYNIDGDLVCQDCLKSMNIYIDEGE